RRIDTIDTLRHELPAWESDRNSNTAKINWHFSIGNAREKLISLIPSLKPKRYEMTAVKYPRQSRGFTYFNYAIYQRDGTLAISSNKVFLHKGVNDDDRHHGDHDKGVFYHRRRLGQAHLGFRVGHGGRVYLAGHENIPQKDRQGVNVLAVQSDSIDSIAFSPDGQRIAAATGKTIKLWNVETGQTIRTMTGHNFGVHMAAFSPDGTRIISVSYRAIKVFDPNTGREISGIDSEDRIAFAACSPDGSSIAAVHEEGGEIKIWNLETGKATRAIPTAGKGSGFKAADSPNGRYIATGHSDSKIVILDIETARELRTLTGHGDDVNAIAFSPDGRRILSGSSDNSAKLWDVQTGRELTSYPRIPAPLTREIIDDYLTALGDRAATSGPFSRASLYKPTPRETALQFGLLVYIAMQETSFLDPQNTAAVGRYEGMLKFISDKSEAADAASKVSRAEIDNYYRQGIGGLIAVVVDEEFQEIGVTAATLTDIKQRISNFYLHRIRQRLMR
ncbi:MAG: WD40 repeat domain-containing protein, partial [Treponema sp.]|nr:WD40 repeat domain-containing protein [Treponema sp.]